MSKLNQIQIPIDIEKNEVYWELVRKRDRLTKSSKKILWLEFNKDGTFNKDFNEPKAGRSLLMSPFNEYFTWQTTPITEIIEQDKDFIMFKTENSEYKLSKIKKQ